MSLLNLGWWQTPGGCTMQMYSWSKHFDLNYPPGPRTQIVTLSGIFSNNINKQAAERPMSGQWDPA